MVLTAPCTRHETCPCGCSCANGYVRPTNEIIVSGHYEIVFVRPYSADRCPEYAVVDCGIIVPERTEICRFNLEEITLRIDVYNGAGYIYVNGV